jgi:hypothetical protein
VPGRHCSREQSGLRGCRHRSANFEALESPLTLVLHGTVSAVAFRIFDSDEDRYVTNEDLLRWLQATNKRGLSAAQLQQIVHNTMVQYDEDGDGQLSYEEFRAMVSASSTERNLALHF